MSKPLLSAAAAAAVIFASCTPPEPVPPPRFTPNPPYPPQPVDAYGQPTNPYGPNTDVAPPAPNPAPNPGPAAQPRPGEYPTAQRTAKPNVVISPYEPYQEVDVSDCTPGQLARDPYNKKIFRVP